jgi:uncharacterized membrane protein
LLRRQCLDVDVWRPALEVFDMDGSTGQTVPGAPIASSSLVNWTTLIYALHAFSIVTGIVGTATVIGAFLIGWPSIIAVILNYVKRDEARGTWLESHFRWQIRTFWFGLLWAALCAFFVIATLGLGIIVVWIPLAIVTVWFIYRVTKGWMRLGSRQPMYA